MSSKVFHDLFGVSGEIALGTFEAQQLQQGWGLEWLMWDKDVSDSGFYVTPAL